MSAYFSTTNLTGRDFYGQLRKVTAAGVLGDYWDETLGQWAASVAVNDRKIPITETGVGCYVGGTATNLQSYTGFAIKSIHDDDVTNDPCVGEERIYIESGVEQRAVVSAEITSMPADVQTYINANGGVESNNMRGTDSALLAASYTAPDNANIGVAATQATTAATQSTAAATDAAASKIAAQSVDTKLTAGRATNLDNLNATVSSRSSHAPVDVHTYINSNGGVTSSNMRGTDNALLAASYTAPDNAGITATGIAASAAAADTTVLISRLTAGRAGNLDNLAGGAVALAATQNLMSQNIAVRMASSSFAIIPSSGSTLYTVDLLVQDYNGSMETPDSTPTFTAANHLGASRTANLSAVTTVATGHYRVTYTVASTHAEEQVLITASVIEAAKTIKAVYTLPVYAQLAGASGFTSTDRTKLDAIHTKLPSKAYLTGTAAADGDIDLDTVDGSKTAFMADVSLLATAAAVAGVPAATQTYINANGGVESNNMRGTDLALLAASYTAPDNANIAVAATQSTTAATQSTAAAADAALSKTAAQSVETRLTVGRAANLDLVDVAISTRSTFDETVDTVTLTPGQDIATDTNALAIKAKTDNLPAAPAAVSDIPTAAAIAAQADTTLSGTHGAGSWVSGGGDATVAKQDAILANLGLIVPWPPSGTQNVSDSRTWTLRGDGEDTLAPSVIILAAGSTSILSMDFSQLLNPGTGITTVSPVVDISGNGLVPFSEAASQDRLKAYVYVNSLTAGLTYRLKFTVTTTDGQTLVGEGILRAE